MGGLKEQEGPKRETDELAGKTFLGFLKKGR